MGGTRPLPEWREPTRQRGPRGPSRTGGKRTRCSLRRRSLLRQPGPSNALEHGWPIRHMLDHRPDRELRIQAASLGQGGLGLIDSAGIGVGRRQSRVNEKLAKARVERLAIVVDRRVEKTEIDLRVASDHEKCVVKEVARAQPHRPLCVGPRLLEAAESIFGAGARHIEQDVIGIDGESDVCDIKGLAGPPRFR